MSDGPQLTRWGRGRWMLVWAVLLAVQAGGVVLIAQARTDGNHAMAWGVGAAVAVVQLLKSWAAGRRIWDLGRPADDALWGVVPVANLLLAVSLLARTPGEQAREKRIRAWVSQLTAVGAWRSALTSVRPALPVALIGSVALAGFVALADQWIRDVVVPALMDPASAMLRQNLWIAFALVALFTAVHASRASTRSTESWWPTTLLAPLGLLLLPSFFAGAGSSGTFIYVVMATAAFEASIPALLSGVLVALVLAASDVGSERSLAQRMSGRTLAVAVVFALRAQLAAVGGIIVIPAIWFSVSYAFSDLLAFDQDAHPWTGSSRLVAGARGKVLKVLAVWYLAWNGLALVLMYPFIPMSQASYGLMGGDLPPVAEFGVTFSAALTTSLCALALRAILRERQTLFDEREARRRAQAGGAA